MLHEHERGRAAVNAMIASLPEAAGGAETAIADFAHASREFIDLLRQHIRKENEILFPMSNSFLSEAEQQALASAFARTEAQHEAGTQERLMKIAEELCQKYRVNWCESAIHEMPDTSSFRSQGTG